MANLGITPGVLPTQRNGNKNATSSAQTAGAGKPGIRAEVLARLKEQAKAGAAADATLFAQWDAEPDDEFPYS